MPYYLPEGIKRTRTNADAFAVLCGLMCYTESIHHPADISYLAHNINITFIMPHHRRAHAYLKCAFRILGIPYTNPGTGRMVMFDLNYSIGKPLMNDFAKKVDKSDINIPSFDFDDEQSKHLLIVLAAMTTGTRNIIETIDSATCIKIIHFAEVARVRTEVENVCEELFIITLLDT